MDRIFFVGQKDNGHQIAHYCNGSLPTFFHVLSLLVYYYCFRKGIIGCDLCLPIQWNASIGRQQAIDLGK